MMTIGLPVVALSTMTIISIIVAVVAIVGVIILKKRG